eukprot:XP_001705910.1 Hypothetical protein GL50803_31484 [Giardia lamblia ATCC 50803]
MCFCKWGNGRTDTLSPGLIVVGVQVDVGKHVRLDVIVFDVEALLGFVIECHCARGQVPLYSLF